MRIAVTSHASISILVLLLFQNISIVNASVGLITFENIASIDLDLLIIFAVIYLFIFFIPIVFSIYFVCSRPSTSREEQKFDKKWYKWKKQWIWHELMFRTNCLIILSLIVIFIFEPEWPFWAPFAVIGTVLFMGLLSKFVSKCIKPRILTEEQKTKFYRLAMHESYLNHHENVYGPYSRHNQVVNLYDDNDDMMGNKTRTNTFSWKGNKNRNRNTSNYSNMIQRFSFKRNKKDTNDKSIPLLLDYEEPTSVELLRVN